MANELQRLINLNPNPTEQKLITYLQPLLERKISPSHQQLEKTEALIQQMTTEIQLVAQATEYFELDELRKEFFEEYIRIIEQAINKWLQEEKLINADQTYSDLDREKTKQNWVNIFRSARNTLSNNPD